MQTLHSVRGVSDMLSEGYENMLALIQNRIEIYGLNIDNYNIHSLANDIAKIDTIVRNVDTMVVCSSDRMLGPVGVTFVGGIKRAFNDDVFSTREQRQAVCNDTDVHMTTHIASTKYPEYWVCNAFIQYVWVDSKEGNTTYASELSQLVGMLLGLNVVIN